MWQTACCALPALPGPGLHQTARYHACSLLHCFGLWPPEHCLTHLLPLFRYGGVVERKNIAEKADWYIYDIQQMIDALK